MELTIRKYTSFDEMKADEYRYWQSRPVEERMDALAEFGARVQSIRPEEFAERAAASFVKGSRRKRRPVGVSMCAH